MKKNLYWLFLLAALLPAGLLLLVLALFRPEQALFLYGAGLLVLSLLLAALFSSIAVRRIATTLNQMDLQHPEKSNAAAELAPLTAKIAQQNTVIARQMQQLRQESASRENQRREFTANVSHELKTPLTTISGTAEILRSGMVRPEDVAHFADNIYRESQRMSSLVSDILKLSQLEEQKLPDRREPCDLYAISQDVLSWLQSAAETQQVSLSLQGEHASVLGAEKILSDMIYNLCDNAIKYNRPGGSVLIRITRSPQETCLTVQDTGIGIPEAHQERVFERFYRVDKSHSREIGGTGLGLSIVKHGAIFHGAELQLQSRPGTGTSISIHFPAAAAQPEL